MLFLPLYFPPQTWTWSPNSRGFWFLSGPIGDWVLLCWWYMTWKKRWSEKAKVLPCINDCDTWSLIFSSSTFLPICIQVWIICFFISPNLAYPLKVNHLLYISSCIPTDPPMDIGITPIVHYHQALIFWRYEQCCIRVIEPWHPKQQSCHQLHKLFITKWFCQDISIVALALDLSKCNNASCNCFMDTMVSNCIMFLLQGWWWHHCTHNPTLVVSEHLGRFINWYSQHPECLLVFDDEFNTDLRCHHFGWIGWCLNCFLAFTYPSDEHLILEEENPCYQTSSHLIMCMVHINKRDELSSRSLQSWHIMG